MRELSAQLTEGEIFQSPVVFLFNPSVKTFGFATSLVGASSVSFALISCGKSELTHAAAPPLHKRSRLLRLLACKRARDAFAALPTFCGTESESYVYSFPGSALVGASSVSFALFRALPGPARGSASGLHGNALFQRAFGKTKTVYNISGFQPFSATCAAKTEQNRRFWFFTVFAVRKCEAF